MSKLTDALNPLGIHNTHNLLTRFGVPRVDDIAVSYTVPPPRSVRGHGSSVWSPSHQTHPDSRVAHLDQNQKRFVGMKAESFSAAKAWATERYRIHDWVTCPFDNQTMISQGVVLRARQFVERVGVTDLSPDAATRLFKALRYKVGK